MVEYIKREDALSFPFANGQYDHENADEHFINGCETYREWLEQIPAADVWPVVRGKWTDKRTIEHDGEWYCTACGKEITIYMGADREDRYAYCPNCGARMEES